MKRLSISLVTLALAGFAWSAHAAGYQCKPISGSVLIAPEATGCTIATPAYKNRFPSVIFLGATGTCFTGNFSGTWGNLSITGTSISGLTLIANPPPSYFPDFVTAATELKVKRANNNNTLGSLYFLDTIRFRDNAGNAEEQLVIIEGTGAFRGAKGSLGIAGNEFTGNPPAYVNGTLCLPDDDNDDD